MNITSLWGTWTALWRGFLRDFWPSAESGWIFRVIFRSRDCWRLRCLLWRENGSAGCRRLGKWRAISVRVLGFVGRRPDFSVLLTGCRLCLAMGIGSWLYCGVGVCPWLDEDSPSYLSLCFKAYSCLTLTPHFQCECYLFLASGVASGPMLQSYSCVYASSASWSWLSLCSRSSVSLKFHQYRHQNSHNLKALTQLWAPFLFYWRSFVFWVDWWRW